jgi:hypothetical protein
MSRHIRPPHRLALACAIGASLAIGATSAAAQVAAPPPNTISATGSAQVEPKPFDKKSNNSIKKAVAAARAKAIPLAIANGRARAATLSQASGLKLGALISIADAGAAPFYFGGPFGEDGSFGPGEYCGKVTRAIIKRRADGTRKVVGRRTSRVCRVPRYVSANFVLVFATG